MKKTPATDPRFDPRFQRGYDGPEPAQPSAPAAPSPMSRPAPALKQTDERPVDEPRLIDGASPTPDSGDLDAFWTPPRRNPFALALLIGGLAFIAVGAWLIWTVVTASTFPYGYTAEQQAFALVQEALSPALFLVGVLAIVSWLVLGALDASARKRP